MEMFDIFEIEKLWGFRVNVVNFCYTYDDIVKVILIKQDFYILYRSTVALIEKELSP